MSRFPCLGLISWTLVIIGLDQQTLGRALCGAKSQSWLSWRCPGFKLRFETALSLSALTNHTIACSNVHVTTNRSVGGQGNVGEKTGSEDVQDPLSF